MPPTSTHQRHRFEGGLPCALPVLVIVLTAGCASIPQRSLIPAGNWSWRKKCVLPSDVTKTQLIKHLNENIIGVHGWQSTSVRIHLGGAAGLLKLSGTIAVESPKNFRLVAQLLGSQTADFGSNSERFWYWSRNYQQHVLHARHDQVDDLPNLPFHPGWLIETLGVVPLDENDWFVQPMSQSGLVSLVTEQLSPGGRTVRRVIVVDPCRGLIVAHELHDAQTGLIARAELNDYHRDPATGISLPHKIHFDWRQAGMGMTLKFGKIDVNPVDIDPGLWQMPEYPGFPPLSLWDATRRTRPMPRVRAEHDPRDPREPFIRTAADDVQQVRGASEWDETRTDSNSPYEEWEPEMQASDPAMYEEHNEPVAWEPDFVDQNPPKSRRRRWIESTRRFLPKF